MFAGSKARPEGHPCEAIDTLVGSLPQPGPQAALDGAVGQACRTSLPPRHESVLRFGDEGDGPFRMHTMWLSSEADVVASMDVDLSPRRPAAPRRPAGVRAQRPRHRQPLAIGSRLANGARVVRGPKRELISRTYNRILHTTLGSRFTDAQCGFKAMRRDAAHRLLPPGEDTGWFFDTEVLILAERGGPRIHEVPVDWVDDPDSRVDLVATAVADLKGVWRLLWRRLHTPARAGPTVPTAPAQVFTRRESLPSSR
jgi:hypothetical protein